MHQWVAAVCQACQLKANDIDSNESNHADLGFVTTELCPSSMLPSSTTATTSSSSSSSSPYIHISTCYSGSRRLSEPEDDNVFHAPCRPPKPQHLKQRPQQSQEQLPNKTEPSEYENASRMQRLAQDMRSLTLHAACTLPKNGFRPCLGNAKADPPFVQRQLQPHEGADNSLKHFASLEDNDPRGFMKHRSVTLPRHFASASTPNFRLRRLDDDEDDDNFDYGNDYSCDDTQPSQHNQEEQIYFFMPSLGSLGGCGSSLMIPAERYTREAVAYTDVYVPQGPTEKSFLKTNLLEEKVSDPLPFSKGPDSAYKKIDFVKTDAFNRTRHKAEEKYNLQAEPQL